MASSTGANCSEMLSTTRWDSGGGGSTKEGGEEIFQDCVFNWGELVGYIVDDSLDVLPLLLVGFLEGNKGALGG